MKGDFSTFRFNPSQHYNRVLRQQGRVELDSDANEQAAITQYLMRTVIMDFLGHAGGPANFCGFELGDATGVVKASAGDFVFGPGRYYVDGLLVENERARAYTAQPELPSAKLDVGKTYLAYLDVWQRHITYLEDDSIREVALGGPDTSTRVKTTWQLKVLESNEAAAPPAQPDEAKIQQQLKDAEAKLEKAQKDFAAEADRAKKKVIKKTLDRLEQQISALEAKLTEVPPAGPAPAVPPDDCGELLRPLVEWISGTLTARLSPGEPSDSPCVLSPESRYRGLENHLYRIEIHASGDTDGEDVPSFKWSRENGSVVTRWLSTTANDVRVGSGRNFAAGQWVEFITEEDELLGQKGFVSRITRVDGDVLTVEAAPAWPQGKRSPKVRRWDQTANDLITLDKDGAIPIDVDPANGTWVVIENGIEVQFSGGQYRTGDYWLIPARVATGAIEWPRIDSDNDGEPETPVAQAPHGVKHHYAPLFTVELLSKDPFVNLIEDCRCRFTPLPCPGK